MLTYTLSDREVMESRSLLSDLTSRYCTVEDAEFLRQAHVYAQELPRGVRVFMNEFRILEPSEGACLISGYTVDDLAIGPTPAGWGRQISPSSTIAEEMLFLLYGSLLGDAIGWITQQDGKLVHDVMPIKGHEYLQLNSASEELIWWHTEDAFHPYRPDYVGLMCLRNPTGTATTIAAIDNVNLPEDQVRILLEPRFIIRPDLAHDSEGNVTFADLSSDTASKLLQEAYERIRQMRRKPQKVAVLFGAPSSPYARLDPYFTDPADDDEEAQCAFNALCQAIDENISEVSLKPGEICFVDNYKAVHGRKPFTTKFDGTDRWLKRILVTRDLRRSRDARLSPESRIIF
jgi:enduracididine beta-hydroxylase